MGFFVFIAIVNKVEFSKYVKVKDKICISYIGDLDARDILSCKKELELKYPELQVYILCDNSLPDTNNIIQSHEFNPRDFIYFVSNYQMLYHNNWLSRKNSEK